MFKGLKPILYGGREVWPLVEGGKGVSATNHMSSGAWAAAGGIGTVSAVNADSYDPEGRIIPQVYHALTRRERHEELVQYAIDGAVAQVERAYEIAGGKGAININVLWEMGGAQRVLHGVLERTKGLVAGRHLRRRHALQAVRDRRVLRRQLSADHQLGARLPRPVEAGLFQGRRMAGRGGLRGSLAGRRPQRPFATPRTRCKPQDPYPRVKALRDTMREGGIADSVPIVMAGGVWNLEEWENWIDNPELGQIVFQFGTRPLLTQESPIPAGWKARLMTLEEGDILLHRFSPTGFYSSAVRNPFLRDLEARSRPPDRLHQGAARRPSLPARRRRRHQEEFLGDQGRPAARARMVCRRAITEALKTPDETLVFVTPEEKKHDPQGPGGLHGLPLPMRLLVLGGQ